ncbi:NAD(P)-binding protein [Venturia nashicola]|uniref:NAD(P)-binding protein n=1 Tax=Venturia nashicola TaxID=86259 RepID=A0A4Z1NLL0_9PEZI|nr:NAD(P)-binding protein [Venturia nashicola]
MPFDLREKTVLITAGSRGLGAAISQKFAIEGSNIAINYYSRISEAEELSKRLEKEYGIKTLLIQGDAGVTADVKRMVQETIKIFGGLDVIIGNAGWTKFVTFGDLDALSEEDWDKCYAVNVKGQMALFREALPTFNANPQGGAFIITSSVAGWSISGSSMAYSVTKAAQLHLMKCLAETQGKKCRVNAVLPGLLLTEWGQKFPAETVVALKQKAALKDVTDLDECADMYVAIAKNTSMTGQKIAVDAGLNVASM